MAKKSAVAKKISKSMKRMQSTPRRRSSSERLLVLCKELDIEMDGVRVPASAAAILNAIRSIVSQTE